MAYSQAFQDQVLREANRMLETHCTIRELAEETGIPKSTIHLHLSVSLWKINKGLARKIKKILDAHYEERTARGGAATKENWNQNPEEMMTKAKRKINVTMTVG